MVKRQEKTPVWRRYWWVFIGALGAVTLASALNFTSSDGWIEITDLGNSSYDLGWNTTKPTVCTAGNYSYWNGSAFLCSPDTTGGGGNASDGNNYTTGISFTSSGNNVILDLARVGLSNLTSFFTFSSTNGILVNNGVFYPDADNCSSGQYSRYEAGAWNCYNDASGGSGTVTSVALNSTTTAVSITGSPIVNAGTLVFEIRNATTLVDGLMTSVQATALASKFDSAGAGLEGSGTTVSIEVGYQLPQGCGDGFVPTWNASFGWWNCSADINQYGNVTALQAGITTVNATAVSKASPGNCVGFNSTHVNVTMNTTASGVQCVAVALNPGSGSGSFVYSDYFNQNLNTTNNVQFGKIEASNNITSSTTGSTEANPRMFGINGLNTGEASRFQFADDSNAIHTAYSASATWYGYWGIVIRGNRQSVGAPGYDYVTDMALTVIGDTNITSTLHAPELCLNGDCRTSWPTSGSNSFRPEQTNYYYKSYDFESVTAAYGTPWVPTAIGSGTTALIAGEYQRPGLATISSSTTASSGYSYQITGATTYLLGNGSGSIVIIAPVPKTGNLTTCKLGFQDVFTTTSAVDGAYWNATQNSSSTFNWTPVMRTNNAEVRGSTITYKANTSNYYKAEVYVINTTQIQYKLYESNTQTLLNQQLINGTVPSVAGRETSHAAVCFVSGATTAQVLARLDYLGVYNNGTLFNR